MKYRAVISYKASVVVEFETDTIDWSKLQDHAMLAGIDQGLIPDTWESIEKPVPERVREG